MGMFNFESEVMLRVLFMMCVWAITTSTISTPIMPALNRLRARAANTDSRRWEHFVALSMQAMLSLSVLIVSSLATYALLTYEPLMQFIETAAHDLMAVLPG